MNGERRRRSGDGERRRITLSLPSYILDALKEFCRDKNVLPEIVVERALEEYFREGDMSH